MARSFFMFHVFYIFDVNETLYKNTLTADSIASSRGVINVRLGDGLLMNITCSFFFAACYILNSGMSDAVPTWMSV